jgi:hypothetical protein
VTAIPGVVNGPGRGCSVSGCGRAVAARGCCSAHYDRWLRTGDPGRAQTRRHRNPDSYWSVRARIRTQRGPASALACTDCGSPARDWSYDWTDPNEKTDPGRGYRYSTDLARYVPRCRSCHRRATRRRGRALDVEQCVRLYRAGHTLAGIAQLTGHSRAEIRRALTEYGITIKPAHKRPRRTHPEEPTKTNDITSTTQPKTRNTTTDSNQHQTRQNTNRDHRTPRTTSTA